MKTHLSRLDSESRQYLWDVWQKKQFNGFGMYVPQGETIPSRGIGRSIVAIIVLAIVVGLLQPKKPQMALLVWESALTAFAVLLLVAGHVSRKRRREYKKTPQMGNFTFVDPKHVWQVRNNRVKVRPFAEIRSVGGSHRYVNSSYARSELVLRCSSGSVTLTVYERAKAEQFLQYHNAVKVLGEMAEQGKFGDLGKNPIVLGAMAIQYVVNGSTQLNLTALNHDRGIPTPRRIDPNAAVQPGAPSRTPPAMSYWRGAAWPWIATAAVLGIAFLGYRPLNEYLYDEHVFAGVSAGNSGSFKEIDFYLAELPQGRHVAEVISLRDDRSFALATSESTRRHSPTVLREYLADSRYMRHRADAQKMINVYYDEAIAHLRSHAEGNPNVDPKLFGALLALMEGLKTASSPVVTVGFTAQQDVEPVTVDDQRREEQLYKRRLEDNSELKDIARRAANHSAILDVGECFTAKYTALRQDVITERLRESMAGLLSADILTLRAAKAGQRPIIEVSYHTAPLGRLYLYTTTIHHDYGADTEKVNGLIRGYDTKWIITLRPPGNDQPYVCKLSSVPQRQLNYDQRDGDPDWAPYAVVLYSGFWNMSGELSREFALEPGKDPSGFSFAAVAK